MLSQAARSEDTPEAQPDNISAENQPPAVIILVVGAAGEETFGDAFATWASAWRQVAQRAGADISPIGPEPTQTAPADTAEEAASENQANEELSDHQQLREAIAALDPAATAPVWIVLIGHGTFSQNVAKFNLRGPDIAADELARWIEPITRPLIVVGAFSSSGPFINALSGENRVIVTATRSGNEQNYSRFGQYLSQAIGDERGDIDHDGEVSILEAFLAASAAVRDFYQSSGRIATEHALIDDNADGLGTPATAFRGTRAVAKTSNPDQSLDGSLAKGLTLAPASTRLPLTDQERIERDEIEAQLAHLRARRDDMAPADYQAAVLPHLIRLARLYATAEARATEPAR